MDWIIWQVVIHAVLLSSVVVVVTSSTTNATEQQALLALKHHISSDPLEVLTTWNDSHHFCRWRGVTCSKRHHQRVVGLNLFGSGLKGTISPFLGNLTFLRTINLANNSFYGQIPQEIGNLLRLRYLRLDNNSIGGEIPLNATHCRSLQSLFIGFNDLRGRIPTEMDSLSSLEMLSLSYNNLIGSIPSSFGNLSSLVQIDLINNMLEGNIPHEIGQLRNLTFINLSGNSLSGVVPPSIYNLSSLSILFATANQLHGNLPSDLGVALPKLLQFFIGQNRLTGPIPESLSNATRLERLELGGNQLSGPIPISLGKLAALKYLNLERNFLGGGEVKDISFIASLINCSSLEMLSLASNRLTGALPGSIAKFSTSLSELYMGDNNFLGSIPSKISNLVNLYLLDFSFNGLSGDIPDSIGQLSKLQVLNLMRNRFTGEIPTSIGKLTRLFRLVTAWNNLHGKIPPAIGNCQRLLWLNLGENNLTGSLPERIFDISALQVLNVRANSLVGSFPTEVGNLRSLRILRASRNQFSGEIPSSLGNCLSLEYLFIDSNSFRGNVPHLSSLRGLLEVDVSQNNLFGQIPEYFESFPYLRYFNLSFNSFDGEVPGGGIFRNLTAISIIGNNGLCGGIPKLLLPPCTGKANEKQTRRRASTAKIVAAVTCSALFFILLLCLIVTFYYRKRKKHSSPRPDTLENQLLSVAYRDLVKATDGFSSTHLIGAGSYGSVYKGTLDHSDMTVAIKVLNLQCRGASKSFLAECKALRNIRHRNLLKVITACSSIDSEGNDFKALIFEYMPNGNLEQWLHEGENEQHTSRNLSLIQRLDIAIAIASALDYLHNCCERPIIHCDIKPSNILLDDELNAHVADFGLARIVVEANSSGSRSHTHATSSIIRGTIGYVPPEYGLGAEASTHGDIYSYGILVLEMLTGKRPSDEIFSGSLNLHEFAKMALPDHVMEIADPSLLLLGGEGLEDCLGQYAQERMKITEKCLTSMISIGVACSVSTVMDRMEIKDVVGRMSVIRDSYLRDQIH